MNENILKAIAVLGEKLISQEKEIEKLQSTISYLEYMEKFREKEAASHVPESTSAESV